MSASKQSPQPVRTSEKLARLETWLVRHRRRYHQALRPPVTKEQLDRAQEALALPLPADLRSLLGSVLLHDALPLPSDLRSLLSWHDGQDGAFVGCFVERWKLLPLQTILDAKKDLDEAGRTNQIQGWQAEWVPFLGDGEGNFVIVDTSTTKSAVREFWEDRDTHPVVAPSLGEWITDFVSAVERGEYTEDPERGEFLRK